MKKLFIILVVIHAIVALFLFVVTANAQQQFKIIRVDTVIQQTVFCTGRAMNKDSTTGISITFRGAGKKESLVGLWVTSIPEGIPRRRYIHWRINK